MTLVVFLLALGLAARLTRLISEDSITGPFRLWFHVQEHMGRTWLAEEHAMTEPSLRNKVGGFFNELVNCPWCTGVWASAASFATAYVWSDTKAWTWIAAAAAASYLVGAASTLVYRWSE